MLSHNVFTAEGSYPAAKNADGFMAGAYCSMCGEEHRAEQIISKNKVMFLPAALKRLEAEAFTGIPAQQITIPEGTTIIGSKAFANCPNLLMAVIPDSVAFIADDAFEGCGHVLLYISQSNFYAADWAFANGMECAYVE